jgi:site-specific DNA-methyltransferase (adenine-specific)
VAHATWTPTLEHDLVVHGDNLPFLRDLPADGFQLIYIDPPFNTGKHQRRSTLRTTADETGDRIGFGGRRYLTARERLLSFDDRFDDYLGFLETRLIEAHRVLHPTGTLYLHLDYREVHYARVVLDEIFGPASFLNEIIWAYDYGARTKRRWPAKHDNVLVYVKDPDHYFFDSSAVEREPYMAPGLVTAEKAARGKLPTDTWWHTIVSPTGKEKTGYPSQKPEGVLRRIVQASSQPGDWVLDFFAGSGTTGAVARTLGRRFVLVDDNAEAIEVMTARLGHGEVDYSQVAAAS